MTPEVTARESWRERDREDKERTYLLGLSSNGLEVSRCKSKTNKNKLRR